jgi:hypothetical protein
METFRSQNTLHLENLTDKFPHQRYEGLEKLEATDVPRIYWLLDCQTSAVEKKSLWKKLILQNARSIQPALLQLDDPPLLYLGVDEVIFILDLPTGKLLARYDSGTPFLWFFPSEDQLIFAVCELEIYAFTLHGGLKWNANFPDVPKEVVKKGECLEVTDLSNQTYRVEVLTGKMLHTD